MPSISVGVCVWKCRGKVLAQKKRMSSLTEFELSCEYREFLKQAEAEDKKGKTAH